MTIDIDKLRALLAEWNQPKPKGEAAKGWEWKQRVKHGELASEAVRALPSLLAIAEGVIAQAEELAKLREQFAASVEVREAITIAEALAENERIRDVVTELVTKLEKGATISAGFCSWCRERWLHPADATPDDVRELSRVHAYRCKLSPLKLERDALQADVAQLRAALTEALDGWADDAGDDWHRIVELRRLADGE